MSQEVIFKQRTPDSNREFRSALASYHTKVKQTNLSYYLPAAEG